MTPKYFPAGLVTIQCLLLAQTVSQLSVRISKRISDAPDYAKHS